MPGRESPKRTISASGGLGPLHFSFLEKVDYRIQGYKLWDLEMTVDVGCLEYPLTGTIGSKT